MRTWKHPDLGNITYDDISWIRVFSLPAFKVFKYRSDRRNAGSSRIEIRFWVDEDGQLPSESAIAVAKKVIENQEVLVRRLKKSFYDDLNGRGPDSGMWWHGNIQFVREILTDERDGKKAQTLKSVDDLDNVLGEPVVWIQESVGSEYDKPCAVLGFGARFEIEHGVGILTDGTRILGTGFLNDVSPFKRSRMQYG
ncbi:MAG: hypothetical protein JW818_20420 [Pirellulales bacterium]|nr:hypothetical protein [Pirellulales bacterium]